MKIHESHICSEMVLASDYGVEIHCPVQMVTKSHKIAADPRSPRISTPPATCLSGALMESPQDKHSIQVKVDTGRQVNSTSKECN